MRFIKVGLMCIIAVGLLSTSVYALDVGRWEMHEIVLESTASHSNRFIGVSLTCTFTAPSATHSKTMDGFYAGGTSRGYPEETWKVRIAPTELGDWSWTTTSSDAQLESAGTFTCVPSDNHGFLHVSPDYPQALVFDNGDYYFNIGHIAYTIASSANNEKYGDYTIFLEDCAQYGFNKIRLLSGSMSGSWAWEADVNNASDFQYPGWPYGGSAYPRSSPTPDFDSYDLEFWDRLDGIFQYLAERDMGVDLILYYKNEIPGNTANNHEFCGSNATEAQRNQHIDYTVARLASYTNMYLWELTNEGGHPAHGPVSMDLNRSMAARLQLKDPYDHEISNSHGTNQWNNAADEDWLTIVNIHQCTEGMGTDAEWQFAHDWTRNNFVLYKNSKPVILDEEPCDDYFDDDPDRFRRCHWAIFFGGGSPTYISQRSYTAALVDDPPGGNTGQGRFSMLHLSDFVKQPELEWWHLDPDLDFVTSCSLFNYSIGSSLSYPNRVDFLVWTWGTGATINLHSLPNGYYMARVFDTRDGVYVSNSWNDSVNVTDGTASFVMPSGTGDREQVLYLRQSNGSAVVDSTEQAGDGSGYVTVSATIDDMDDSICSAKIEYSLDDGSTWENGDPYIDESYGVTANHSSPLLDNTTTYQLYNIITSSGANTITFRWNTKSAINGTGSLDNSYQANVKIRITPNNGLGDGFASKSDTFAIDNLPAVTANACDVVSVPSAGQTTVLLSASFTEQNPDTNTFYAAVSGGSYSIGASGDGNTATPGNQVVNLGVTLDGSDNISKVKCEHQDDYINLGTNENTSPSNSYVIPYTPGDPHVGNATASTVDVTVMKNASEAIGLKYCIHEVTTDKYVDYSASLSTSPVYQTAANWGTGGKVTVLDLTQAVTSYYFRMQSVNSGDDITAGPFSIAVNVQGKKRWIQTTDVDFNAGISSYTVVVGTGVPAEVQLDGWAGAAFSGGGEWEFMREFTVSNPGNKINDYQIEVVISTATFNYSDAEPNGEDVRFSDSAQAELSYWIENWNASGTSSIWVRVSTVAATGDTNIYMYYGNSGVSSSSDGNMTFEFYDDFSTDTSADYTVVGAGTMVYDSVNKVLKQTDTGNAQHWLVSTTANLPDAYVYYADVNITNDVANRIHAGAATDFSDSAVTGYRLTHIDTSFPVSKYSSGSETSVGSISDGGLSPVGTWLTYIVTRDRSSGFLKLEATNGSTSVSSNWTNSTHTTGSIGFHSYGCEAWWDNIRVRKYVSSVPTVAIGAEIQGYRSNSWYVSPTLETENVVSWDTISWTETLGNGTYIQFQVATGNSPAPANFVGPGGSAGAYYSTSSGDSLWAGHNADSFIRYKAYLLDDDYSDTPALEDVTIDYATSSDITAPAAITDLAAATGGGLGQVILTWTAPGDNGTIGDNVLPAYYTVKYATYDVTGGAAAWWAGASEYSQSWQISLNGDIENHVIESLSAGVTYWFAIKTTDESNNESAIDSNATSAVTQAQAKANESNPLPTATTPGLSQAINGTGLVNVSVTVDDAEDAVCSIKVEYSLDGGSSWIDGDPYIDEAYGVTATNGSPGLDNNAAEYQISSIETSLGANTLSFKWDTQSATNGTGSLDDALESSVKIRVTPNDGVVDGTPQESAVVEIDNLDPIVLSGSDLTANPEAGYGYATVDVSFTESNPGTNLFYVEVNNGGYSSGTAGDGGTADPSACSVDAEVTFDSNDEITKVKCAHTDMFGNTVTSENSSPSNSYVKPYKPAEPVVVSSGTTAVTVTVRKNASEVAGLEYCIYETSTTSYAQANGSLDVSEVWQTITNWGAGGEIVVTGLSTALSDYKFQTRTRNPNDSGTMSDYSNIGVIAAGYWLQTDDTDFNAGTTSDTVVSGTGDSARIELEQSLNLSNPGVGSWDYRRQITVTNSGSEQTDYQVEVTLTLANFDNYSNCDENGADIRFTADDGTTELDYWIDTWDTGEDSTIWVEVPTVSNPSSTIYIYYGNGSATDSSDGEATFLFFDDFEGASLDTTTRWDTPAGTWAVSTDRAKNGLKSAKQSDAVAGDKFLVSKSSIPGDIVVEAWVNSTCSGINTRWQVVARYNDINEWRGGGVEHENNLLFVHNKWGVLPAEQCMVSAALTLTPDTWYRTKVTIYGDNTEVEQFGVSVSTTDFHNASGKVGLKTHADVQYYDDLLVRKYASPEPSAVIGSEGPGGGLVLSGTFISDNFNPAEVASWDNISWTETTGNGTEIKLQVATGSSPDPTSFVGPGGSAGAYYSTSSGESLWVGHNDDSNLRFKAFLSDDDGAETPILEDISIFYTASSNMAPDAPVLVSPANSSGQNDTTPTLTWDVPADLDGDTLHFKVEISTEVGFGSQVAGSPFESNVSATGFSPAPPVTEGAGQVSYTLQSALAEKLHYWKVSAWDGTEAGETSIAWNLSIDLTAPSAITDLFAETGSINGQVDLTWTAPKEDTSGGAVSSYSIKYATFSIADLGGDTTAWWNSAGDVAAKSPVAYPPKNPGLQESMTITGLTPEATYWFSIKSVDEANNTSVIDSVSPQASANAKYAGPPDAPTGALLYPITVNSMTLNWDDNSSNEDGFKIEKSFNGDDYNPIGSGVGANITQYSGSGMSSLSANTRYWYRVYSHNVNGNSVESSTDAYTLANKPGTPTVTGDYDEAVDILWHTDITINTNSNPVITEYAVFCGTESVQADGLLSGTTYWSTTLTRIHKKLNASRMYSYTVKALNGDRVATAASDAGQDTTPPAAGVAAKVALGAVPTNIAVGGNTTTLTATVQDVTGATVTGSTATITFNLDVNSATLPGGTTEYVVQEASNGVATAVLTAGNNIGAVTVTAVSAGLEDGVLNVDLVPAEAYEVVLTSPTKTGDFILDAGESLEFIATIYDQYGHRVLEDGTITFIVSCGTTEEESEQEQVIDGYASFKWQESAAGEITIKAKYGAIVSGSMTLTYYVPFDSDCEVKGGTAGKTKVTVPEGTFEDSVEVRIDMVPNNEAEEYAVSPTNVGAEFTFVSGTGREFNVLTTTGYPVTGVSFTKNTVFIYLPYLDVDGGGVIDDLGIPVLDSNDSPNLRVFHLNEVPATPIWVEHVDWPLIDTSERTARVSVKHFSKYCLMAIEVDAINNLVNYPNPFSPEADGNTYFVFSLSVEVVELTVNVYTLSGRLIRTIEYDGSIGEKAVPWDGTDGNEKSLANGVYLYRVIAGDSSKTGKLVIMQ